MSNNNEFAFPHQFSDGWNNSISSGMTLRDYFAAKVLQGIMANTFIASNEGLHTKLDLINAKSCYAMADAMLEARK